MSARLVALARWLERPVRGIALAGAWMLPVLVVLVIFDAIGRKSIRHLSILVDNDLHHLVNSPVIQDAEWHLHAVLVFVALGYAYVHNAHVRLDLFRPRLGRRGRLWLELIGGATLLLPFLAVLLWFGAEFVARSWATDERSWNSIGIDNRWFIKSFVVLGLVSLACAALAVWLRCAVRLLGPPDVRERAGVEAFEADSHSPFEARGPRPGAAPE